MLFGVRRQDQARHLARRPDMDRAGEIHRNIERSGLDADGVDPVPRVPQARAAHGAEVTGHRASAVRRARPGLRRALRDRERRAAYEQRHAERRCRLPLAFATVAHVKPQRRLGDRIADRTALAPTGQRPHQACVARSVRAVRTIGMQPARCARRAGIQQVRPLDPAAVEHARAARIEGAARLESHSAEASRRRSGAGARHGARARECCPSGPRCRDAPDA